MSANDYKKLERLYFYWGCKNGDEIFARLSQVLFMVEVTCIIIFTLIELDYKMKSILSLANCKRKRKAL